ncbi:HWE histidine kinase domain-containing protein [Faunimonas pinastri]|nr:HWE histidine kinase domain-containing protein [Faunimonas pinastri]
MASWNFDTATGTIPLSPELSALVDIPVEQATDLLSALDSKDGARLRAELTEAAAAGRSVRLRFSLSREPGTIASEEEDAPLDLRWWELRGGGTGDGRLRGLCLEITDGVKEETDRIAAVRHEESHRMGNLFSMVLAIFRQTAHGATSIEELSRKFGDRINAVSKAHSAHGTKSVHELVAAALSGHSDRVAITGPDARLDPEPSFHFSMALHELSTNAADHGCFTSGRGTLAVTTDVVLAENADRDATSSADSEPKPLLRLVWKESGTLPSERGPEGFGNRMIAQVVERQLHGRLEREMERDGLKVTIELPL